MALLYLATFALLGLIVLEAMINRPVFAAGVVLGSVAIAALTSGTLPELILAGFNLTISDAVFGLLSTAGLARSLRLPSRSWSRRLLLFIIILTIIALILGMQLYGPDVAVREFRTFLYFFGGAFYFSTVRPTARLLERFANVWLAVACVLIMIALMRWVALAIGLPATGVLTRTREVGGLRVIDSRSALIVAQGFLMVFPLLLRREASTWQIRLAAMFVPALALLQHRTIWLVLILGGVLVLHRSVALTAEQVGMIVVLGAVVLTLLIANPGYQENTLVERSPVDTGSLDWRWNSWVALIADETSSGEWLTGTPFGSGFERELYGSQVDIIPHNWYVEILYRLGALGLLPFLLLYGIQLRRWHARRDAARLLDRHTIFVLLMTQVLYFVFWDPGPEQGTLLGLAIAGTTVRLRPSTGVDRATLARPEVVGR